MTKYVYVTQMGDLYRLTWSQWIVFLKHRANGWVNVANYGVCLESTVLNVTDWDESRAYDELNNTEVAS